MQLNLDPGFDADLELAHRALDRGWVSREAIESAILEQERTPGSRLLNLLPLTPEQRRRLESPDAKSVPDEIVEAARDPARRVDHYILGEHLQSGGMGRICKAWDVKLSRWVALKFLKAVGDERSEAYFEREARLAAQLSHPNIATIYGSGQSGGDRYIAMQFIPGRTLDAWRRGDPLRLAALVRDAARAVAYANGRGIIHRDLKPMNVMVTPEGRVCVLDFGLARPADSDARHSATGKAMGTPAYMSPEQARGASVSARSDVYGLGATLYECLTGKPPFTGKTIYDVLRRVEEDAPVKPRKLNPHVPADLETIVLKCLEKDPARRYGTADGLADDLERFLNHDAISARPSGIVYRTAKLMAKRKAIAIASAASLVLAGVLGWWFLVGRPQSEALQAHTERLRLRESAMTLWAEARGAELSEDDPGLVPRKAKAARVAFERALSAGEDAVTYLMIGRCFQLEGQDLAGVTALNRAHELDSSNGEVRLELAKTILLKYRESRGFPELSTSIVDGQVTYHQRKLVAEREDERKARERAEKLLKSGEVSAVASGLLNGLKAMGEGRHAQAADELARYTKVESWDSQALWFEGVCRSLAGDHKAAIKALDRSLKRRRSAETLWWRANAHYRMNLHEEALADYTQALKEDPKHSNSYISRGLIWSIKGDKEKAIADYTKVLESDSESSVALTNRGMEYSSLGRLDEAIADFTRAIAIDPTYPKPHLYRGGARVEKGLVVEGLSDMKKCLELAPDFDMAWYNLGRSLARLQRRDEAIQAYTRAIELNPKHAMAFNNRGAEVLEKGQIDEAIADFNKAIALDSGDPNAWGNRAFAYQRQGRVAEAVADYQKALVSASPDWPHRSEVTRRLAALEPVRLSQEANKLHDAKRYVEAIELFRRIVETYPLSRPARSASYTIACGYALLGDKDKALEWLEKSIELGFKDAAHMEKDPDLASLREQPGFNALLERLKNE